MVRENFGYWILEALSRRSTFLLQPCFFWLVFSHRLSPMDTDNILTWDGAILVAALVAKFEIDFARVLISLIHERAFKAYTTYPFAYMII